MESNNKQYIWLIDPVHTRIRFEATYLMISKISGWFRKIEGKVITEDENFNSSRLKITLYSNSVFTGNEDRDNHLKSADFLDAANFPSISFVSEEINNQGNKINIKGLLLIKQEKLPIEFSAFFTGTSLDELGNKKAGFSSEFTLDRNLLKLNWNKNFGDNNPLISSHIKLHCEVQLLQIQ